MFLSSVMLHSRRACSGTWAFVKPNSHTLTWDYRLLEIQIINKVIKDLPTYLRTGKKTQKAINHIEAMKKYKAQCERAET